jgi:hypothetical protein
VWWNGSSVRVPAYQEVNDPYNENYKTLIKEIEKDIKDMERQHISMDWKSQCCSKSPYL